MNPIYITRQIPQAGLDVLREQGGAFDINQDDHPLTKAELKAAVKGRSAIMCLLTDTIDGEVLDAAGTQLKVVANVAVGYNNIDVNAAKARNVIVTNTPGVLTDATADCAWALLMASARRLGESERVLRAGKWPGWGILQFLGQEIAGRTLGIVGAGRIGYAVGRRARGFDMKLLYTARTPKPDMDSVGAKHVDLETCLRQSDFVSLHVPLTAETKHLIGKRQLEMMKPTAHLINTARGPVVDEAALVEALKTKRIAGAGLDVYEEEPKIHPGLLECENAVLAPHIGSATTETRGKMATMAAQNVAAVLKGQKPLNPVL
ncbi:MAG TPA: D-glycerate dehydrogenase [Planctomycetota bacterium]|nr:D-glycerate dehydrogenase [Planctomycetota bacterium]